MPDAVVVKVGMDSSGFHTGLNDLNSSMNNFRSRAERTASGTRAVAVAAKEVKRGGASVGEAGLQIAQAADDVQYGVRGILNNIPGLVLSMGGGVGLAGVASLAVLAMYQLYNVFQKIGPAAKVAAQENLHLAQVIENAQQRIVAVTRQREEMERDAQRQAERLLVSQGMTTHGFEAEAKAINDSTAALKARNANQAELDSANRDLELAKVDLAGGGEIAKLKAKFEIEQRYADSARQRKQDELSQEAAAAQKKIDLENKIATEAEGRQKQEQQAIKEKRDAEASLASLQSENDGKRERAIALLRKIQSEIPKGIDPKFDVAGSDPSQILKEAARIASQKEFLNDGSHTGSEILVEKKDQSELQGKIDDAKAAAKIAADKAANLGGAYADTQAAYDRRDDAQEALRRANENKATQSASDEILKKASQAGFQKRLKDAELEKKQSETQGKIDRLNDERENGPKAIATNLARIFGGGNAVPNQQLSELRTLNHTMADIKEELRISRFGE